METRRTPTKALHDLVSSLNATSWSSWQSTAKFWPALEAAEQALAQERIRDAAPDLLDALQEIISDGMHCDVVPHLHYKALAAIAKATGVRHETALRHRQSIPSI